MPTIEATIASEIASHQYAKADADLRAVISTKPDSAKAHYWLGQVLGDEGRPQEGLTEIERAKSIDPTLAFTNPATLQRVESALQASASHASGANAGSRFGNLGPGAPIAMPKQAATTASSTVPAAQHGPDAGLFGFSSGQILLGLVVVIALAMFLRRRQTGMPSSMPYSGNTVPPGSVPPGYGYPPGGVAPPSSGIGSILGGAAGGFLLGEMLGHSRDAGATTIVHDVVHDTPPPADSGPGYDGGFDPGNSDGGSFGGDGGGGFDSGSGGGF
jgi:hypothetical protein